MIEFTERRRTLTRRYKLAIFGAIVSAAAIFFLGPLTWILSSIDRSAPVRLVEVAPSNFGVAFTACWVALVLYTGLGAATTAAAVYFGREVDADPSKSYSSSDYKLGGGELLLSTSSEGENEQDDDELSVEKLKTLRASSVRAVSISNGQRACEID